RAQSCGGLREGHGAGERSLYQWQRHPRDHPREAHFDGRPDQRAARSGQADQLGQEQVLQAEIISTEDPRGGCASSKGVSWNGLTENGRYSSPCCSALAGRTLSVRARKLTLSSWRPAELSPAPLPPARNPATPRAK